MPLRTKSGKFIYIILIIFIAFVFAFSLLKTNKTAYADDFYVEFYFCYEDVVDTHYYIITDNEDLQNIVIPQYPAILGKQLNWYDQNGNYFNVNQGFSQITETLILTAYYELFFNTQTNEQSDGNETNPFIIDNEDRWLVFIDYCNSEGAFMNESSKDKYFILTEDLDMATYNPSWISVFEGELDGNGKKISNLSLLNEDVSEVAGIVELNKGVINNLHFRNAQITSTSLAAGIAIENDYDGTIQNCSFSGSITSQRSVGFTAINRGQIINCYNKGEMQGTIFAGGFAMRNLGNIESCYNFATIIANELAGGIAGLLVSGGNIAYCYNTGVIELHSYDNGFAAGGLVAVVSGGDLSNCYNSGDIKDISSFDNFIGAIIGRAEFNLNAVNCYYDRERLVEGNNHEIKDGYYLYENTYHPWEKATPLDTLDITGGDNQISFTDISKWIYLSDDLNNERVYYPQLSVFYNSEFSFVSQDSNQSVEKNYATCNVILNDDNGDFIASYKVFSNAEKLAEPIEKSGYNALGWSQNIDGNVIDENWYINHDITLYAVYELKPIEFSFNSFVTTYGSNEYPFVIASHDADDAVISYKWYKIENEIPVLLSKITGSVLTIENVNDSGLYQCDVTAYSGRYSASVSQIRSVIINPYTIEIDIIPVFSKTYGDEENLTIFLSLSDLNTSVEIIFTREEGEQAGAYDITGAYATDENFSVIITDDMEDSFLINKADYAFSFSFMAETFVYDGNEHMLRYVSNIPEGLDLNITMIGDGVSAGQHIITANFIGDSVNYNSVEPISETMYITKADYDITGFEFSSITVNYNGKPHNIHMSGSLPQGLSVSFSVSDVIDTGVYIVNIVFNGDYNNYNTVSSRQETITVYPKSIVPEFVLPENMVSDGKPKIIEVTSSGIIAGDKVTFSVLSNNPLIEAGTYVITAHSDNPNYTLYNNTIVIKIYAPQLSNSSASALDISVSTLEGFSSNYAFYADTIQLGIDIIGRFNAKKITSAYHLRLLMGDEEVEFENGFNITMSLPQQYFDAINLKLYYYNGNNDTLESIEHTLSNNVLSFNADYTGYFILVADEAAINNSEMASYRLLKIVLYIIFAVMLLIIVGLIILIGKSKKRAPQQIMSQKTTGIIQLSEKEREIFNKKLNNYEFVDWELNRDLPRYAIWKKDKLD